MVFFRAWCGPAERSVSADPRCCTARCCTARCCTAPAVVPSVTDGSQVDSQVSHARRLNPWENEPQSESSSTKPRGRRARATRTTSGDLCVQVSHAHDGWPIGNWIIWDVLTKALICSVFATADRAVPREAAFVLQLGNTKQGTCWVLEISSLAVSDWSLGRISRVTLRGCVSKVPMNALMKWQLVL